MWRFISAASAHKWSRPSTHTIQGNAHHHIKQTKGTLPSLRKASNEILVNQPSESQNTEYDMQCEGREPLRTDSFTSVKTGKCHVKQKCTLNYKRTSSCTLKPTRSLNTECCMWVFLTEVYMYVYITDLYEAYFLYCIFGIFLYTVCTVFWLHQVLFIVFVYWLVFFGPVM